MDEKTGLRVTVLGSGTSAGVPMIGCHCAVCTSDDPRDRRTRPSVAVHYEGRTILVDTTPELRLQAVANGLDRVDAVVFTHAHADHIFGLDDVRRWNTVMKQPMPLYGDAETLGRLRETFAYAFAKAKETGVYRPELVPVEIAEEGKGGGGTFDLFGRAWEPLRLPHGAGQVLGFKVGDFAYCTDCSAMPAEVEERIRGVGVLIIDALRPRPHPTHLSYVQALEVIARVKPGRAFFTHLAHDVKHAEIERELPEHVRACFDGLRIEVG